MNNLLTQSPFSFENYLNSYSRDNEKVCQFLNNKKIHQANSHDNKQVGKFLDVCNFSYHNKMKFISAKKIYNPLTNLNSNLEKLENYNNLDFIKINNKIKNSNNEIQISNFSNLRNQIDFTNRYEKSPIIPFPKNKLFKDISKRIEKEISLDLSETNETNSIEKGLHNCTSFFLKKEAHIKNLNFDQEEKRYNDIEPKLNNNNLFLEMLNKNRTKINNYKINKRKKSFRIEDFYLNETEQKINSLSDNNISFKNCLINSAESSLVKKKLFSCLDDSISKAFNSQKKSKNNNTGHSRIRKNELQIKILEKLVKDNRVISRELITQATTETALSFSSVYKWLWDKNNKIISKIENQSQNVNGSLTIFEDYEEYNKSKQTELHLNNTQSNKIFKINPNWK